LTADVVIAVAGVVDFGDQAQRFAFVACPLRCVGVGRPLQGAAVAVLTQHAAVGVVLVGFGVLDPACNRDSMIWLIWPA